MKRDPQHGGIDGAKLTRWYNAQARFYGARRDDFDGELVQAIATLLDTDSALHVLDAGCGTGLFSIGLAAAADAWRIEGVDAADAMLDVARGHADRRQLTHVSFRVGDVEKLDAADETYDAVIAGGLFPNLNGPERALREFHRVLVAGGRLVVVETDRASMGFGDRFVFRAMVWGYRAVSTLLPQFKFARGWSLERSTLDPADLQRSLVDAAFDVAPIRRVAGHYVLEATRR